MNNGLETYAKTIRKDLRLSPTLTVNRGALRREPSSVTDSVDFHLSQRLVQQAKRMYHQPTLDFAVSKKLEPTQHTQISKDIINVDSDDDLQGIPVAPKRAPIGPMSTKIKAAALNSIKPSRVSQMQVMHLEKTPRKVAEWDSAIAPLSGEVFFIEHHWEQFIWSALPVVVPPSKQDTLIVNASGLKIIDFTEKADVLEAMYAVESPYINLQIRLKNGVTMWIIICGDLKRLLKIAMFPLVPMT